MGPALSRGSLRTVQLFAYPPWRLAKVAECSVSRGVRRAVDGWGHGWVYAFGGLVTSCVSAVGVRTTL